MRVAEDKSEAVLTYVSVLGEPHAPFKKLKLGELDPERKYTITELNQSYYGDELMNAGINIYIGHGDFQSIMWKLEAE